MNNERYKRLVADICQLTQIPVEGINHDLTELSVRGVGFSFFNVKDTVLIHANFGPLPERRRDEVLLKLMSVNFHLFSGQHPCCFSHNQETGQVIFSGTVDLASIGAPQFVHLLGHIAEYARAWQHNYFISEDSRPVPSAHKNRGGL